jgi:cytochrome c biogenesis protein CcdA
VLLSGLLYTFGRAAAYIAVSVLILSSVFASDAVARFLQRYLNQILGPVLILVGMVLLGWLGGSLSLNLAGEGVQQRAARGGLWWSGALGFLFALSFCPVSAGLFFGGLLPLAARSASPVFLPLAFGVGTALPVVAFAFLIAFAGQYVGRAFDRLTQVERWVRAITGAVFVLAGLYICLAYVYAL